jgi:D-3-phosphoglycerate dehydrogenase / 2-oxoglutarate reductase
LVANARPLKLIQQQSAGYDAIDVKACSERGIPVANSPTGNTVTVAEHTIAVGFTLMRNLVAAGRSVREGRWERMTLQPS